MTWPTCGSQVNVPDPADADEEDDEDDEEECYATTCPECEEEIFFDDSVLEDGKVECPNCGATLEFDPADLVEDEEEKGD